MQSLWIAYVHEMFLYVCELSIQINFRLIELRLKGILTGEETWLFLPPSSVGVSCSFPLRVDLMLESFIIQWKKQEKHYLQKRGKDSLLGLIQYAFLWFALTPKMLCPHSVVWCYHKTVDIYTNNQCKKYILLLVNIWKELFYLWIWTSPIFWKDQDLRPVVQSIISFTSSLRGQLVKGFTTL